MLFAIDPLVADRGAPRISVPNGALERHCGRLSADRSSSVGVPRDSNMIAFPMRQAYERDMTKTFAPGVCARPQGGVVGK